MDVLGSDSHARAGQRLPDRSKGHEGRADDARDAGHVGGIRDGTSQRTGVRWEVFIFQLAVMMTGRMQPS
jgi:hypothetical protein